MLKRLNSKLIFSILFAGLLFLVEPVFSQSPQVPIPENPKTKERIVLGGSAGLAIGNSTFIELLPLAGYRLSDRLSLLAGPMYSYFHDYITDYSDNIYGARGLARFFPLDNIYLQAEIDNMSYGIKGNPIRKNSTLTMLGVGYYQYGTTIDVMYITNRPVNANFLNPFLLRVGFVYYLR